MKTKPNRILLLLASLYIIGTFAHLNVNQGHRCLSDVIQSKVKVNAPSKVKLSYEATIAADNERLLQDGSSGFKPIRIHLDYNGVFLRKKKI